MKGVARGARTLSPYRPTLDTWLRAERLSQHNVNSPLGLCGPDISVVRRIMKNRRPVKRYVIDGKVMEPRDLRQLHRHMLEADGISSISDELRNLVESEWPVLAHKLPPKEPQK